MTPPTQKWIATFTCALFALACGYSLWCDLTAFGNTTPDNRLSESFADALLPRSVSSFSKAIVLDDCFETLSGYRKLDMLSETNRRIAVKCAAFADQTVAVKPTDSYAWFVKALAAARLLDIAPFNHALRQSQLTGPNEQWISTLRVRLAEQYFASLDKETMKTQTADLRMLVTSVKGLREISQRYMTNPEFRSRITAIVEQFPQQRQRAFLRSITNLMKNG